MNAPSRPAQPELSSEDRLKLYAAIAAAFSPHAPINKAKLFKGRTQQVQHVLDCAGTPGLSCVIYGERGVGKTSLANTIGELLQQQFIAPVSKVNCTDADTFASVTRRALATITVSREKHSAGLLPNVETVKSTVSALLPENPSADLVAARLQDLPGDTVLIFDEFDRLPSGETVAFADFIKAISDRNLSTTIMVVGVAEDVSALIRGHASVERCLRQIYLQRMSDEELKEIIQGGLASAGMALDGADALRWLLIVSQGFPHYAHLLGQHAARAAIESGRTTVTAGDVFLGMAQAVDEADQSLRDTYHRAVTGTKKANIWKEVVTACAIAACDERGYFSGPSVGESLARILKRPVVQQNFAYHLGKLTEPSRGPLIVRTGTERRYRYRFLRPLIRPFVTMKAYEDGLLDYLQGDNDAEAPPEGQA